MGVLSPANGAETGFDTIHVNQGGFALGATISAGSGKRLVVPATGVYLVSLCSQANATVAHSINAKANGSMPIVGIGGIGGISTSGNWTKAGATAIAFLNAGDWISLFHSGGAQFDFGPGKTELSMFLL